jgi:molecular chaperone GrpE
MEEEKLEDVADKQINTVDADGCAEVRDRLIRLAAEFDNYKKRVAKEKEAMSDIGKVEIIKKIIPSIDELELVVESIGIAGADTTKKGVELVYSNMVGALRGEGLKDVGTEGKYDPYIHEILMVADSNADEGKIIEVVRKGYVFKDILVRPASVIIAKLGKKSNSNVKKDDIPTDK